MKDEDHDHSADAIAAVELNAEDLVDLSRSRASDALQRHAERSALGLPTEEISVPAAAKKTHRPAASSKKRWSGVGGGIIGVMVVASIAMGAHYAGANYNVERVTQQAAVAWTPIPEKPQIVEIETEVEVEAPPTLFRNPFDKTEVFEFPPGTTKEEARERVAQILLERARERTRR